MQGKRILIELALRTRHFCERTSPRTPVRGGNPNPRYPAVPCVPSLTVRSDVLMIVETRSAGVWIPAFAGMTGGMRWPFPRVFRFSLWRWLFPVIPAKAGIQESLTEQNTTGWQWPLDSCAGMTGRMRLPFPPNRAASFRSVLYYRQNGRLGGADDGTVKRSHDRV